MEGKFAGEGPQNIDEDDDMLSAMARELVKRNGIGDTARPQSSSGKRRRGRIAIPEQASLFGFS